MLRHRRSVFLSSLLLPLFASIFGFCKAENTLCEDEQMAEKFSIKEDMASDSSSSFLVGAKSPPLGKENSVEIEDIAKFAVDEFNRRQNSPQNLVYSRVVSVQKQVVAGTLYHLTIEVLSGDQTKLYEAKVWSKPWEQHLSLEEFKTASNPAITPADLGARRDSQHSRSGGDQEFHEVPSDDPVVKDAAEHALAIVQQRSNSLFPYELQNVVSAHTQVTEDRTNFQLLLKVKRGTKDEHLKVEVHRFIDGKWS